MVKKLIDVKEDTWRKVKVKAAESGKSVNEIVEGLLNGSKS